MLEGVWNGKVVVNVQLYPQTTPQSRISFYTKLPRINYPHTLIPLLSRFYSALGDDLISSLLHSPDRFPGSFEYRATGSGRWVSAPWNRPLGLLCDISASDPNTSVLVLRLVLTPTASNPLLLLPQHSAAAIFLSDHARLAYFNALKESEALRRTRHRRVMEMSREDQALLWEALCSADPTSFCRFSDINGRNETDTDRAIPLKVYITDADGVCVARTGPIIKYDGLTVGEAIESAGGVGEGEEVVLVTHGIVVDRDMPIKAALSMLCYPDNTLHIVVAR